MFINVIHLNINILVPQYEYQLKYFHDPKEMKS